MTYVVIWRGYGWLVPFILFSPFFMDNALNAAFGDGFYEALDETLDGMLPIAAYFLGPLLVGLLGYILNYKQREVYVDEETGETIKSPSHTFFFIPIEYWSIIYVVAPYVILHWAGVDVW